MKSPGWFRPYAFPAWVLVFVVASMMWPAAFGTWAGFDLRHLIVPLIQIIMFGMGTTLSLADFTRVLRDPWPVFVGFALQFTVMPLLGYSIAMSFGFEPEVAAGIILVGCVSGGVASNLITYLANGNVALSVTMTACSTIASPFVTPILMKVLAGKLVPIDVVAMMFEILSMVLVPLAAGLVAHHILYGRGTRFHRVGWLLGTIIVCALLAFASRFIPTVVSGFVPLRNGLMIGFILLAVVAAAKLVIHVGLGHEGNWMDRALSLVAMTSICFIIAIITSRSRDKLLTVGPWLIVASLLHNAMGYLLGYWASRLIRLDERTCRTVSIEVGMQNAGMASGLAMSVLQSASTALPPAIFGPLMNVTGSLLASWWKRRQPGDSP